MPQDKYQIFDEMIEGIQIINPRWEYVYVNNTVALHGKYTKQELLGFTMMEKFPGIENTEMFARLKSCMADRTPHQMVNEFDFPDGSKGYFELRIQPVEEGVLVLSFDVTKQKLAEQILKDNNTMLEIMVKERTASLVQKNKEMEHFAYIASHDLQEPLRTVSNYLQLFEEDYGNQLDDTAKGYIKIINRATKRMGLLSRSLLDYSRLGVNKSVTRVNCFQIVQDVLADLSSAINASMAIVEIGNMPILNAYETELRQLFQNLITNAIKFKQPNVNPRISIESEKIGDHWKFWVRDNGIGIDSIHFERIFQIFQRLHLSDEYEGCGIGLANCKKIIELHNGEINVESTIGKGSVFSFTISNLQQ